MAVNKVLVTGSSGTIGTRLCEKLLDKGIEVTGIDCRKNKWSKDVGKVTVIGDIIKDDVLGKVGKDFDMVVHLAANARVYNLVVDPSKAMDNFRSLFNTLEFCRKNGIKRFMFASSREVYGNTSKVTHSEDEAFVKNCESPYTASKIGGEALVHAYNQCYGMEYVIIRFSNVYGMYDESDRVIPLYIRQAAEGKGLVVYGKGKLLDFTYIDDAVSGVMSCIERFESVKGNVFNIASGKGYSIEDIARMVIKLMGSKNTIRIEENRTGEVVKFIADIGKARKFLSYDPKVGIEEGIKRSVEWYKSTRSG